MENKLETKYVIFAIIGFALLVGGFFLYPVFNPVDYTGYIKTADIPKPDYSDYTLTSSIPAPVVCKVCEVCESVEAREPADKQVLDFIWNEDGNINFILDDLDDDELDQIPARIEMINSWKIMGISYIEAEFADELDKEVFTFVDNSTLEFDEDDIEKLRIDDDMNDILVDDIDFEDGDAVLIYQVKWEQDDYEFEGEVEIEIDDGSVDEIRIYSIAERA